MEPRSPPYDPRYVQDVPTNPESSAPHTGNFRLFSHVPDGRSNAATRMNNSLVASHNPAEWSRSSDQLFSSFHEPPGFPSRRREELPPPPPAATMPMDLPGRIESAVPGVAARVISNDQINPVPPPLVELPGVMHSDVSLPVQDHAPNAMSGGIGWQGSRNQNDNALAERFVMSDRGNAYQRRHEGIGRSSSFANAASATNTAAAPAPTPSAGGQKNNFKTRLCKQFSFRGKCSYGASCKFAHSEEEKQPRIRLCPFYLNGGACCHDNPCYLAHSEGELPYPEKFKTRLCQFYLDRSSCPHGNSCLFAHGKRELRRH